jgi:hypothetical protein
MQTTLNFFDSSSLPANAAVTKAFSWSFGTSILNGVLSMSVASQINDEDPHTLTKSEEQVNSEFLLNVVVF